MIERVVVPVDFGRDSSRALGVATVFAEFAGASVELVTVVDPIRRPNVERELANLASTMSGTTTYRIVETPGPTEAVLLAELRRGVNELWCVGSHARGAVGELLAGSLSEELVREAHVPVALVGPHASAPRSGRVLAVALDGTAQSEAILPAAAELATSLGMTLRLLQVDHPGPEPLPSDISETAYLRFAASHVPTMASQAVDYDILHGDHPAHNLADYVATHSDVAMVVLATRGLSPSARVRHGSTAFELSHRTVVPVVILHPV